MSLLHHAWLDSDESPELYFELLSFFAPLISFYFEDA